jgi:hypothetical protein
MLTCMLAQTCTQTHTCMLAQLTMARSRFWHACMDACIPGQLSMAISHDWPKMVASLLCVCQCVCMYASMRLCIPWQSYAWMYVYIPWPTHVCMYACMYPMIDQGSSPGSTVCVCVCVYVRICMMRHDLHAKSTLCVCVYVCMYAYVWCVMTYMLNPHVHEYMNVRL